MKELFYELLQVAVGRLECLSRGPSPEEWLALFELARQQKVEGVTYHGVECLFEYGLRAPQDVSIDWMSEAEVIKERNAQARSLSRVTQYYPENLRTLRQSENDDLSTSASLKLQHVYNLFLQRRLNMRLLMDYYFLLRQGKEKKYTPSKGGWAIGLFGIHRFAGGLMWVLQTTLGLEQEHMPWKPQEQEGRFLLREVMRENSRWQRFCHMLKYFKIA